MSKCSVRELYIKLSTPFTPTFDTRAFYHRGGDSSSLNLSCFSLLTFRSPSSRTERRGEGGWGIGSKRAEVAQAERADSCPAALGDAAAHRVQGRGGAHREADSRRAKVVQVLDACLSLGPDQGPQVCVSYLA